MYVTLLKFLRQLLYSLSHDIVILSKIDVLKGNNISTDIAGDCRIDMIVLPTVATVDLVHLEQFDLNSY